MAIVLLVLAVVSIVGVGLLTQSTMDLKFATSYKSHTTAFNLADGAASLALARVSNTGTPSTYGQAAPSIAESPIWDPQIVRQGGTPRGPTLTDRGTYWPLMVYQGPITDPTKM